jgi:hypothetical protein
LQGILFVPSLRIRSKILCESGVSDKYTKIYSKFSEIFDPEKTYFDTTRIMDAAGEMSPAGVIFDGEFKLEKFLRHDGHADVHSVIANASQTTSLEARVYSLEGLPRKARQYRMRSIQRLTSRTVLETRWQGMVVVVYKAGGGGSVEDSEKACLWNGYHSIGRNADGHCTDDARLILVFRPPETAT